MHVLLLSAGRSAGGANITHAGAWGLLRNALQEFPALAWSGEELSPLCPAAADGQQDIAEANDAFGSAAGGGLWAAPRLLPQSPQQEPSAPGVHALH